MRWLLILCPLLIAASPRADVRQFNECVRAEGLEYGERWDAVCERTEGRKRCALPDDVVQRLQAPYLERQLTCLDRVPNNRVNAAWVNGLRQNLNDSPILFPLYYKRIDLIDWAIATISISLCVVGIVAILRRKGTQ